MLHLRGARCGRSAAASAALSTTPSRAAWAQEAPSAPNKTPPLAIYVRFFALFFFWHWFSMQSFLFSLANNTALNIAILHLLTSWPRACFVGLGGLCVRCLR